MGAIVVGVMLLASYSQAQATPNEPSVNGKPVYAYYYLWWSEKHWHDKLGPNYPYDALPLPLPATTDADGCNPLSLYTGNQLLDVSPELYIQDDPGVIEDDIRIAKDAGVNGFWLNWGGNGSTNQTRASVTYTARLAEAFAASSRVGGFTNWVSYKTASMPSADEIINDLNFLYDEFKNEPSWEKIDGRPVVTLTGSRKFGDAALEKISNAVRSRIYLVGDESGSTLTDARLALFDGLTYYWSSQNPYTNAHSFDTIKRMGETVHAAGKSWYAPLTPGYNSNLIGGSSCVPRRDGDTMRKLWEGNSASNPDGWGLISWNEIAENTHVKPMQKWGPRYLDVLSDLIGIRTPVPPTPTATNTAVASPTATLSNPGASETIYDDKDGVFSYSSPAWQQVNTSKAYSGSFMETDKKGSFVEFDFTGQSFSVIYKGGVTYGEFKVYVDGIRVATLNQKMSTTSYQQRWDYPGQLELGSHTLRLTFNPLNKPINRGSVDAIIVR